MRDSKSVNINEIRDTITDHVTQAVTHWIPRLYPPIDIYVTNEHVVVRTGSIDGVDSNSIRVSMMGADLTIRGVTYEPDIVKDETITYLKRENQFGEFSRTVYIPVPVEAAQARASVKRGVLTILLPKITSGSADIVEPTLE